MAVKIGALYLIASWACGFLALFCQAFQPVVLNRLTRTLTSAQPLMETGQLASGLCVFFVSGLAICLLTVTEKIVEQSWIASAVRDESLKLFHRILLTTNDFLIENESETVAKRIDRDIRTWVNSRVIIWTGLPVAVFGLAISAWTMFRGSSRLTEFLDQSHQRGNTVLALTIVALLPLQVIFLLFNARFVKLENRKAAAEERGYLVSTETLRGVADLRASHAFSFALKRLRTVLAETRRTTVGFEIFFASFRSTDLLVQTLSQMVVLGISAYLISKGQLTFADYMGFTLLCAMFDKYVKGGVALAFSWVFARQARRRVRDLRMLPDSFGESVGRDIVGDSCNLKVSDLTYVGRAGTRILSSISFDIPLGTHVGLVGPSASGKSTLLRLMMRHISPTRGAVFLGATAIGDIRFSQFTSRVASVPQRPFLFNGSIRDNILLGRDLALSEARLFDILEICSVTEDLAWKVLEADACSVAAIDSDRAAALKDKLAIAKLSNNRSDRLTLRSILENQGLYWQAVRAGLDVVVGCDGKGLSGGQMAKVALARALAGTPDVLLLDELTASLDDVSKNQVLSRLGKEMKGRTLVFVSHDLFETQHMDFILVLHEGRLVQKGRFSELATAPGVFAQLLSQGAKGGYDLERMREPRSFAKENA